MPFLTGKVRKSALETAAPYAVGDMVYVPRTDPEVGWDLVPVTAVKRNHVYADGRWRLCNSNHVRRELLDEK